VLELLRLLNVSDDDALRAALSVFASVQPGPVRQSWLRSKDYGSAPSTRDIWNVFVRDGFCCQSCGSHGDLTIDHRNRNNKDISPQNLRVMCRRCNRASSNRAVKNLDAGLRIYRAIRQLIKETGRFPSRDQIRRITGISELSGSMYMVHFFEHFLGNPKTLRAYTATKTKYS
jgi:hypothetical protein